MATGTSVLKLVVDDKQYEASLKNARQGMMHLQESLQAAGKTFSDVDGKVVEYARALGRMDTASKTAKGRIGELSGTFVELKMQYQHMTDLEKQSPIGQAMSKSLEELKERTIEAKRELEDLNKELNGMKTTETEGGNIAGGALSVFGGNLMTKGFELAQNAAMGFVNTLKEAAAQGIEMARAGEGVRNAFERLNQPGLLDNLREATHGTVTNLELMKAAVKFNDFNLPLKELGTMLAFAQQKAKDTGQSVDYMVDSIVTGLGRKSLMILDNLGLSAATIKERMAETGDMTTAVGEIIREQMSSAGDYVETAADRATAAQVELNNALEDLGRTLLPLEEQGVSMWNKIEIAAIKMLNDGLKPIVPKLIEVKTEIGEIYDAAVTDNWLTQGFINWLETGIDVTSRFIPYVRTLKKLIDGLSGGGDMGASVGAAISGAITDNTVTDIPEVVVTGNKPKNPKGGSKTQTLKIEFDINKAALAATKADPNANFISPWSMADKDALREYLGIDKKQFDYGKDITEKDYKNLIGDIDDSKLYEAMEKLGGNIGKFAGGLGSISSGLKSMGVELPKEVDTVIGVISGLSQIITGVSTIIELFSTTSQAANTAAVTANTIAIGGLIAAVNANTFTSLIPGFARGGIVPHAANGYIVPGNSFSGDNTPIMANAGEVVLNQAQQGNLASRLSDQGRGMNIVGEIQGEKIVLVANRFFKRTGQGEIVTW